MYSKLIVLLAAVIGAIIAQTPGVNVICVPNGTCIPGGPVIDPRIVVPTCAAGQQACNGNSASASCGLRHVTNAVTTDGTSVYGSFPWQAFIRTSTGFTASGVLIDNYHVLTAAHKVVGLSGLTVYMGVHNPENLTQAQARTVQNIIAHPNYELSTLKNDIAIIRLSSPIALGYQNNIGTACLPPNGKSFVGQRCTVSGWGSTSFTSNDAGKSVQRQVTLPIVDYNTCRNSMLQPHILGQSTDMYLDPLGELCAGGELGKDACSNDGGAPLVCRDANGRFEVAGLVIWGKNCGQAGVYGVYVDVAKYRNWINAQIGNGIDPRSG